MKELIDFMARSLVDQPDQVVVHEAGTRRGEAVYELTVAPDDVGKVIGRQGRTARAMRNILAAAASLQGRQASLDILD